MSKKIKPQRRRDAEMMEMAEKTQWNGRVLP